MFGGDFSRYFGGVQWSFVCIHTVRITCSRDVIKRCGVLECVAANQTTRLKCFSSPLNLCNRL